jgi:o-succinylbenzoate synthase
VTSIAAARLVPYRLQLAAPHTDARGGFSSREGVLLELTDAEGRSALGDCCPLPGPGDPLDAAVAALREVLPALAGAAPADLYQRHTAAAWLLPGPAAFALESAVGFLAAQQQGLPLSAQLEPNRPRPSSLAVNALVDAADVPAALEQAELAAAEGYAVLKVKVGLGRDRDLELLRSLRERLGSRVRLRLDANGAWPGEEFLVLAPALRDADVDLVEQPVSPAEAAQPGRLAALRARNGLRIALDESLAGSGAAALVAAKTCDAIVLKPSQLGLAAAARLARTARAAGIEVIVTGAFESGAGYAAVLEFAAAFGSPGTAHGLATALAVADDLVEGVPRPAAGSIALPPAGVVPRLAVARETSR